MSTTAGGFVSLHLMQDAGFVQKAFSGIAERYVLTNHVLSMGIQLAAVWALLGALEKPEQRPHNQSLQSTKNGS